MIRWSTPPGPSLALLTDAERSAIAFANGVLVQTAKTMRAEHSSIADAYREQAETLRSLLDRCCR